MLVCLYVRLHVLCFCGSHMSKGSLANMIIASNRVYSTLYVCALLVCVCVEGGEGGLADHLRKCCNCLSWCSALRSLRRHGVHSFKDLQSRFPGAARDSLRSPFAASARSRPGSRSGGGGAGGGGFKRPLGPSTVHEVVDSDEGEGGPKFHFDGDEGEGVGVPGGGQRPSKRQRWPEPESE
jgi:hypothetical protein